jgi:hypothetical protein
MSFDQTKYDYFKAFLDIDKDNMPVDEASRKQPVLRQEVGEFQAAAHKKMEESAALIKPLKAALNLSYRDNLTTRGEKFTESKIESLVESDPGLAAAVQDAIDTKNEYERWEILYSQYESRERTIANNTRLVEGAFIEYNRAAGP